MKYVALIFLTLIIISCEKYDEEILPVVGVYEANVVGVSGPFSISVSSDRGNRILIDAPWDGENWAVLEARIRNEHEWDKDIVIREQWLADGVTLVGEGIFFDYSIQLDYIIWIDNIRHDFTIVGTKL
ncbi:hypothetical protein [Portibacter marinus]|uniref:hypothetical protein n=1 Tax=Portibacter marinus TaxID=2898660 RepID=UPI001F414A31|nr:hypothetical protein [Portibacter marinus]